MTIYKMSTFKIYSENINLNKNDLKSSFKPGEKIKVLQELQVNGRVLHRPNNPDKKKLSVCIGQCQSKPKSADDVKDHKHYFRFDIDDGRKKNTTKRKPSAPKTTTSNLNLGNVEILAKKVSRSRHHSLYVSSNEIMEGRNDGPITYNEFILNQGYIFDKTSRLDPFNQNETCHSPIPVNNFTAPYILLLKTPERKRYPKLPRRISELGRKTTYVCDIFMEEYLEDIMQHVKAKERTITLPDGFLEKFKHNQQIRAAIVNWMISVQRQINISEGEFYLAVNLVDQILARIAVPTNMYQLLAICSIWVINKFVGSNIHSGSVMINLSNNAYIIQQLVQMERKVLRITNFQLHSLEPSVCMNYYLKYFGIGDQKIVRYSVYYILDCSTLLPEFSSVPVTILVAAALGVAVKIFFEDLVEVVLRFFNLNMSTENMEKRKITESQIYSMVLNMTNEKYMFREAHFKFNAVDKKCLPFH